jgi:glycosyltransferase involved in cell wall biosynthesis
LSKSSNDLSLPIIALVTPSFNQAKFVGQTINSVKVQNYPRLKYVVQDACSMDGTAGVLKSFDDAGYDIRIEPDSGQADALNKGFARAPAEIMGYLNSDDLLLPGTLHFVAQYFHNNPSVDVIYGNRLIIDEFGQEIGRWILPGHDPQVLRFVDYVPQESMFWRRRIWEGVGAKFDSNLQFAMDWDLILRFEEAGAVFHHVPELFGVFRAHGGQKSQANFVTRGAKEMATLRFRYRDAKLSRLQRIWLHTQYLYRHVKVDATWQSVFIE